MDVVSSLDQIRGLVANANLDTDRIPTLGENEGMIAGKATTSISASNFKISDLM